MQKEQRPALKHPLWLLLTTPIILTALLSVGMLVYNGYISLTQFNGLNLPEFIGLKNYGALLSSAEFWVATGCTALVLILSGGICVGLGWLGGTGAARLPMPLQVAFAVLAGLGTMLGICFGHIDAFGKVETYHIYLPIQLILVGIGPALLIFYIGALTGRSRVAWHIAVGAIPVWMLVDNGVSIINREASFFPVSSKETINLWLPDLLDHKANRIFDIGSAGALLIMMLVMVGLLTAAAHIAISRCVKSKPTPMLSRKVGNGISLSALILCAGVTIVMLILLILLAITPDCDPLALFPTENISAKSFATLDALYNHTYLRLTPVYMLVSLYIFFVAVLPPAVWLSFSSSKFRRPMIVTALISSVILSFFLGLFWTWSEFGLSGTLLISMMLECFSFPAYPAALLLTTPLLRRVTAGSQTTGEFLRSPRRVGATAVSLTGAYLLFSLALPFAQNAKMVDIDAYRRFPLAMVASEAHYSTSVASAAAVLLIAVGAVLLIGGVVAIAVGVNKILPKTEQN